MKILRVINGLGSGGAERLVSQLRIIIGKQHEVTLVSVNSKKNFISNFPEHSIRYVSF
jgi:hypothetical protein